MHGAIDFALAQRDFELVGEKTFGADLRQRLIQVLVASGLERHQLRREAAIGERALDQSGLAQSQLGRARAEGWKTVELTAIRAERLHALAQLLAETPGLLDGFERVSLHAPAREFARVIYTALLAVPVLGLLQRAKRVFAFQPPRRRL